MAPNPRPHPPSHDFFLLQLRGKLEVFGDQYGQLVGRPTIDDINAGKVRLSCNPSHSLLPQLFLTSFRYDT